MADVVIHHCTLRVRRRNGWSWGPEPRALLESAMRSLPKLLAQHLASLWPENANLEISTPLKIRLPLSLSELGTVPGNAFGDSLFESSSHFAELGRRFEAAINTTLDAAHVIPPDPITIDADLVTERDAVISKPSDSGWTGSPLLLLLKWHEQGLLETRLASFSHASLVAWHRHLFPHAAAVRSTAAHSSSSEVNALARELAAKLPDTTLDRIGTLRRRLIIAVSIAARFRLAAIDEIAYQAIDALLPLSTPGATVVGDPELMRDELALTGSSAQVDQAIETVPSPQSFKIQALSLPAKVIESELRISSVIPFLLLGPLARVGYLETLAATLETAGLTAQSSLFALALAHKVLEPPDRGWRRDPASLAAASAFAGLDHYPPEPALVEFASSISKHLSPLESILSGSLAEGHRPGQPLLLQQTAKPVGLLLMDVDGSFPIAWSSDLERLLPVLAGFGTSVSLIPQASADPELLARLDAADCLFLTDGPPARGERWRALRSANHRWWTNDQHSSSTTLLRSARRLSPAREIAEEIWNEFDEQRPSVPLSSDSNLDKHLTLAASVALGTIAWTLWHEQETTTPQLALTRFRNLDARVRFERRTVRVFLPLGRRYQDLMEHRLLDEISCVPWLNGRSVQFGGG